MMVRRRDVVFTTSAVGNEFFATETTATTSVSSVSTSSSPAAPAAQSSSSSSSSRNALVASVTIVPALCIIGIIVAFFVIRRHRRQRALEPEPSPSSTEELDFKDSSRPQTADRMQYPPIHDQHTKTLPLIRQSLLRSKSAASISRFTLRSVGSGMPSFRRKRSASTFTSSSSPCVPELPITADEPMSTEPLSRRSTRMSGHSFGSPALSEVGEGHETFLAHSGVRLSHFYPFLSIDPAARPARNTSPVPSSSVSTRHMSFLPPYRSPRDSVHSSGFAFAGIMSDNASARVSFSRSSTRCSRRSSVIDISERKKRPKSLAQHYRRTQRKSGLFGPRSPSSWTNSLSSGSHSTASPLTLASEMAVLFPEPPLQVPARRWMRVGSQRSTRHLGGPRPSPSRTSQSTASPTSPGFLTDDSSNKPLLRPLPFIPQQDTSKSSSRRSFISRLSGLAGAPRSPPPTFVEQSQNTQETQVSSSVTLTREPSQQAIHRSLPSVPPHTPSIPISYGGTPPSPRRKLPSPNTVPTEGTRTRPPLPPIPSRSEEPSS